MAGYRDLKVWRVGMRLATRIYRLTAGFLDEKKYGLTSQMRRAAVSVPSNIAEGHARNSSKEMIRFSSIALGSLAELETQLLLSRELVEADASVVKELLELAEEAGRMLHGLIRSQRNN